MGNSSDGLTTLIPFSLEPVFPLSPCPVRMHLRRHPSVSDEESQH